jgi:hypothetical protein
MINPKNIFLDILWYNVHQSIKLNMQVQNTYTHCVMASLGQEKKKQ